MQALQDRVLALPGAGRRLIAIAGAPGAGKSTLAAALVDALNGQGRRAALVPMDGFHLDDGILAARGLSARKGAPDTFDVAGLAALLGRLRAGGEVICPVFDRDLELSRGSARVIEADRDLLVVEGNYLLLQEPPWQALAGLWDLTVFLDVPLAELERRLIARWRHHGKTPAAARDWAMGNDIPNARRVIDGSATADLVLTEADTTLPASP